ncbi:DoxX family protein [Kibdelosporangium aridum]|uniref:DoxX-like family protein n=1 Tax=Kibdelosporangium aridum TaxID=2030 RepID=A0A1W2A7U2_KIBAR|nr:DoxX family protein [Kibdelosporangium aridum]SMC56785.1 DoxX-like family protein [Kibdelosporangium aridum]
MSDGTGTKGALLVVNIVLWLLQIALGAYFLYSAYMLFFETGMVNKFNDIGSGQWLRYVTGVLETAGAIGLLIPGLSGLAALGLALVMVGASATEIFILENGDATLPLILLLASVVVAIFRRGDITRFFSRLAPGR